MAMRVTDRMIFDSATAQTLAARDRVMNAQQQVTTGQRVFHPGDDPAAAGIMVSHQIALDRYDTLTKSIGGAQDEAQVADGTLQNVGDLLARVRELAVQLGNDSNSASERASGAQEIIGIKGQIAQLMNTQVAGRYIFGGTTDNKAPFDATGAYFGDTNVRQVEVAPGLLQNASVRADVALKGVNGGVDVFATLDTLATALTANDGATVRASLDGIVKSGDQVASALTETGGMLSAFQSALTIGSTARDSVQKVLASETDADIFAATSELSLAQQSLQASLAVSAKSFSVSLLDFLK